MSLFLIISLITFILNLLQREKKIFFCFKLNLNFASNSITTKNRKIDRSISQPFILKKKKAALNRKIVNHNNENSNGNNNNNNDDNGDNDNNIYEYNNPDKKSAYF